MHNPLSGWRLWIDRGGTFTDVVARDPQGALHVRKLLSEDPERYADAPLHAIRGLLGLGPCDPIPAQRVAEVKMGTTLATNALLERQGEPAALLVTRGFADLLAIATQDRPEIFALDIHKPRPLAATVDEVDERVRVDGTVERALDDEGVRATLARLRAEGFRSVAVVLLHAWAWPEHERRVGALALEADFEQVSLSHRVAREIKAVGRGDTTLVDATLTPVIRDYVRRVRAALGPEVPLWFAQSSGGLAPAERFSGKDAVLSGPAGGVVACAAIARRSGLDRVIGFDMGGTSTDVSRWAGSYERVYEKRVAGVRIKAPMLHIETVAAGGGSVLDFDGQRYTVGPRSAGANPGPACYRRGGPATVTDANLTLGRIQPRWFPACFGETGARPIDPEAALERLAALAKQGLSVEQVAAGCVRIANEQMVAAIREISVARGHDPQDHALICFGGAGAQHACALASELGIRTIVVPPLAGVLSAWGIGLAEAEHGGVEPLLLSWGHDATPDRCEGAFARLEREGRQALEAEGFAPDQVRCERRAELRYRGVDACLDIAWCDDPRARFEGAHQRRYGFAQPDHPVEIVNLRVVSRGLGAHPEPHPAELEPRLVEPREAVATVPVHFELLDPTGARTLHQQATPVFERSSLQPGDKLEGPALIVEDVATTVVDPGWSASVDGWQQLVLSAKNAAPSTERVDTTRDPVLLEVFGRLFSSIADQMGTTLELAAHSVNIKERLDFSCALFDGDGGLVANAHHIPVHLGAMGASVRALLRDAGDRMRPGDAWASNDPFHGGSHLPDVTVVSPVFLGQDEPVFFVANRGHHADIGGVSPGSMPPDATRLEQEGVVLHALRIVRGGRLEEAAIREALTRGPWPARDLAERMSDLRAQVAANQAGRIQLEALAGRYGWPVIRAYMGHVRDHAEAAMRRLIARLPDGEHRFEDRLDCGARIACCIDIRGDRCVVDFAGSDPQLASNLNAPPAVTMAAVLYAFRTLVDEPVPLNEGCLQPIDLRLPAGSLLDPAPGAAVAGGNVETSMRVCDVVLGALGALAACQGTMNNLNFGTEAWGYYETICGGAGAGPGFHGAHAVHTHMTNTRITDPEVLEHRYPVLVERFGIRRGSGGAGRWRGGDGAVRELRFLQPMEVTMLSERREQGPFGLAGGEAGALGRNTLIAHEGPAEPLPGAFRRQVRAGDILRVETPGGGGYGSPASERSANSSDTPSKA